MHLEHIMCALLYLRYAATYACVYGHFRLVIKILVLLNICHVCVISILKLSTSKLS